MKHFGCWLIISLVLLMAFPAMAANTDISSETAMEEAFSYVINEDGTVSITDFDWESLRVGKYGSPSDVHLVIPSELDGRSVTAICTGTFEMTSDEISAWISNKLNDITSLNLPGTLQRLEDKAFWGLPYMSFVNIPNSLCEIGYSVFEFWPHEINISPNHPVLAVIDGNIYHKVNKELLYYGGGKIPEGIISIGDYAFAYKSLVDEEIFPSTLQRIGDYAFYQAEFSTELSEKEGFLFELPDSITEIGEGVFCEAEFTVVFPENFEERMIEIHLPDHIQSIGASAFENIRIWFAYGNRWVLYSENASVIAKAESKAAPSNTPVELYLPLINLWLPESLESMGQNAFASINCYIDRDSDSMSSGYYLLTQCIIPESAPIRTIPSGAFTLAQRFEDSRLHFVSASVIAPVTTIEDHAADGMSLRLSSPALLQSIGVGNQISGFLDVSSFPTWMTEIPSGLNPDLNALPETVTSIASQAYTDVRYDFVLGSWITFIAPDAFTKGSTFIVENGTYAEQWCIENGFRYAYDYGNGEADLDWLSN